MRILVVRNTLVAGVAVDAGTYLHTAPATAAQLIAMGKAVAVEDAPSPSAPHLVGIEHAVDVGAMTAERRDGATATDWGDALITDIDGIGPVTAGLLAEAGIATMADLLATEAAQVALLARVNVRKAQAWQQRAQALVRGET